MPGLRISFHWELLILATNPLCSEWRCRWTENRRTKGSLYNDASFCLSNLIGFFAGLRSLTAPAATAWAAYFGWTTVTTKFEKAKVKSDLK
jgi:hypothetical protein